MLKNEKGFTLVELLAVLVILAIILAIAIPSITSIVDSTKKSAFESDVKMLIKGVEYKLLQDPGFDYTTVTANTVDEVGGDPNQYDHFKITKINPVTITVVAKKSGKFGRLCVENATFSNNFEVKDDEEFCNGLIPPPTP